MLGLIVVPIAKILEFPREYSIIEDELFYGHYVTIIEIKDCYFYVKTEYDQFGYIEKSAIQVTKTKHTNSTYFTIKLFVDLLEEPNYASSVLLSLPLGSIIQIKNDYDSIWSKVVLHNNKIGYIKKDAYKLIVEDNPNQIRNKIINTALRFLGTNYKWGGKTILGIDCSGLVHLCYLLEGITIYRNSTINDILLSNYDMVDINRDELRPADLIYITGHVMMYLGNDQYIHSSQTQSGVTINSLNSSDENYLDYLEKYTFRYIRCIHN